MTKNKKMKRLVAGFCAVGMLATISADEPVAGWNLARWGMTTAEIQALYPNIKAAEPGPLSWEGRKYHSAMPLAESIRAGGYDFQVRFLMDDSEKLAAVHLEKHFKGAEFVDGEFAFDAVKELLVQKYGKQTAESNKGPYHPGGPYWTDINEKYVFQEGDKYAWRKVVWQSAKAQIAIYYAATPVIRQCQIVVHYAMPGDTDKL